MIGGTFVFYCVWCPELHVLANKSWRSWYFCATIVMLPSSHLPHLKHRSGRQCQIAVKNITLDFSDKGLHAQYQHPIVQKKSVKSSTGTEFDAKIDYLWTIWRMLGNYSGTSWGLNREYLRTFWDYSGTTLGRLWDGLKRMARTCLHVFPNVHHSNCHHEKYCGCHLIPASPSVLTIVGTFDHLLNTGVLCKEVSCKFGTEIENSIVPSSAWVSLMMMTMTMKMMMNWWW